MLTNYLPKQSATFKPNPNYWNKPRPYLDSMVIKFYSDNATEVIALQAGDIDIMVETPFQGSQALFSDPNITTSFVSSSQYRELHMQVTQKPWDDKRVRQAFALTLDRNAIIQALFNGNADIGNDNGFAPVFPTYVQIPQRAQDINQAKSLLAAAGYANGFNAPLTTENYLEIPQYVQIVKQHAALAGINITLNVEDQGTYYGSGANQPWLQVPFGCVDWASRGSASQLITPAYTTTGVWNSAKWSNPQFDTLLKQYDAEPDLTKRKALAQQLETIQTDEVPAVIAYFVKLPHAMRKNVHGLALGDTIYLPGAYKS
jgi:peptide/nickel transport system substrate-binding protein